MHRNLLLSGLLLGSPALAMDIELKTDLEYSRSPETREIQYKKSGAFDELDVSRKTRWESKTLLILGFWQGERWTWQGRMGMNYRRTQDMSLEFREDGSLKNDKSRTEWRTTPVIGAGFRYDIGRALGGYNWTLDGYHDRFIDVSYKATSVAADANQRSGRGTGHESKLLLNGEYMTPVSSLFLQPRLEVKHQYFSQWHDSARERDEAAEQELQYEASLWLSWIPPLDGWELTLGPTWQREDKAERDTDSHQWSWEDEERWLGQVRLEYEAPVPGFEFEFKIERHLNGPDRREMKYQAELSYEF